MVFRLFNGVLTDGDGEFVAPSSYVMDGGGVFVAIPLCRFERGSQSASPDRLLEGLHLRV
jgi:hypothetical protein